MIGGILIVLGVYALMGWAASRAERDRGCRRD